MLPKRSNAGPSKMFNRRKAWMRARKKTLEGWKQSPQCTEQGKPDEDVPQRKKKHPRMTIRVTRLSQRWQAAILGVG